MLMDLFHDVVPTNKKKRVHFNAFMLDVHHRIHSLKNSFAAGSSSDGGRGAVQAAGRFDPIPPVASDIARESWLICFDEFQVLINFLLIFKKLFLKIIFSGYRYRRCYDFKATIH